MASNYFGDALKFETDCLPTSKWMTKGLVMGAYILQDLDSSVASYHTFSLSYQPKQVY